MTTAFIRTIILYLLLITGIRLMGKRQVGELEPTELVLAMLLWALRKLNVLYVPGLSMILLAASMLLVGSIMFQLKEKKKVGGTLIFAFGLFCIVAAVVEIRNFVA